MLLTNRICLNLDVILHCFHFYVQIVLTLRTALSHWLHQLVVFSLFFILLPLLFSLLRLNFVQKVFTILMKLNCFCFLTAQSFLYTRVIIFYQKSHQWKTTMKNLIMRCGVDQVIPCRILILKMTCLTFSGVCIIFMTSVHFFKVCLFW